jgi:tetratricopeptide (TPR) repeat protein
VPVEGGTDRIEALGRLDAAWSEGPGTKLLEAAARAQVGLALGLVDATGTADAVAVKAIALLALAETAAGPMPSERAVLARSLGYEKAAASIPLDDKDPARAYAASDLDALSKTASSPRASDPTRLMYLDLLSRLGHADEIAGFLPGLPRDLAGTLPVKALRLGVDPTGSLAFDLLNDTAAAIERSAGRKPSADLFGPHSEGILPLVEKDLDRIEPPGPFLDGATLRAYCRTHLYASLDAVGGDLLDRLDSTEAATQLAIAMGRGESEASTQYVRYAMDRIAAAERRLPIATLVADLDELDLIGPRALFTLWDEGFAASGPGALAAAAAMARRCDTRPEHRAIMAHVARSGLVDLAMFETLATGAVDEAPASHRNLDAWLAYLRGDGARLEALLDDPALTGRQRAHTLSHLTRADAPVVKREHERLVADAGPDWGPTRDYVEWLEERGEHEEALCAISRWLKRRDRDTGVLEHQAIAAMARQYHLMGRNEEAWQTIEPILPGMLQVALVQGALIRLSMGMLDEAERLAAKCLDRYPDAECTALMARVHWESGRNTKAATLLRQPPRKLTAADWRTTIGRRFVETFSARPAQDGRDAFLSLADQKIEPRMLMSLAGEVDRLGEHELAFEMASGLELEGDARYAVLTSAYRYLASARDRAAAIAWLRGRVEEPLRTPFSEIGYGGTSDELTWDIVPDPSPGDEGASSVWLMRTAAYVRSGAENDSWRRRLDDRYDAIESPDLDDRMGLFLLARIDEDELWSHVTGPAEARKAAYVCGLRACYSGDTVRAARWFRASLEYGARTSSVTVWARDHLLAWRDADMTLERIAAAGP